MPGSVESLQERPSTEESSTKDKTETTSAKGRKKKTKSATGSTSVQEVLDNENRNESNA